MRARRLKDPHAENDKNSSAAIIINVLRLADARAPPTVGSSSIEITATTITSTNWPLSCRAPSSTRVSAEALASLCSLSRGAGSLRA
jgi:hypothetical protein